MKKKLCWTVVTMVLALILAACGQTTGPFTPVPTGPTMVNGTSEPSLPVVIAYLDPAEGVPQSFEDGVSRAEFVVLGDVISVEPGPDFVENPPAGDVCQPTQRVTVQIVKAYKGALATGQRLVLFQQMAGVTDIHRQCNEPGGASDQVLLVPEIDPLYQPNQRYLLALVPVDTWLPEEFKQLQPESLPEGLVSALWMGRLLVNADATVSRVVADAAGQAVQAETVSRTLEEMEALIVALLR